MTGGAIKCLGWADHRATLSWLGLLYLRPEDFGKALDELSLAGALRIGVILTAHALIYVILAAMAARWLLFGGLGLSLENSVLDGSPLLLIHAKQFVYGFAEGIGAWIAVGIAFSVGIVRGIDKENAQEITNEIAALGFIFGIFGIAQGIAFGITFGMASGIAQGITQGITFGIISGIISGILESDADILNAGIGFWLISWIASGIASGISAGITSGLGAGIATVIGRAAVTASHDAERIKALKAVAVEIAREAAGTYLAQIDAVVSKLPEGDEGFLAETRRVRKMATEIAMAQRIFDTIDRPFLRQPYAEALASKIEVFHGKVSGFHEPLASEFGKAAHSWSERAQEQLEQNRKITGREPAPQVFRAGDPVDRSQEAFVPRMGAIGQIERQIVLSTGCPGLLIYGRRRMGKSTLIRNLDAFVPETVRIANFSMQNPSAFSSTGHFVRQTGQKLRATLNGEAAALESEDLGGLFELLSRTNAGLEKAGRRLVLAIDEFENIDKKIGEGVFSSDLLATIRESIQSHRRLIWVFAGSHPIAMLKNAEWPSYLVSVQTIEVPPFTGAETRLLLTDPLKRSPLYAANAERRPRFEPGFWGEGGIEWIQAQTAGWPHLVQLLANVAVDFANESESRCLDRQALEEAARRAIVQGDTVFRQLLHGESQSEAEQAYIAAFRRAESQPVPDDEVTLQSLRHRQIITEEQGVWRLKVPLMQQWLRTRG